MHPATIPPSIFQTWKSKTDIPPHFAQWSASLRRLNPAFAYALWDDADNRAFIAREFSWFLPTYDAYPAEIYRADVVRYFYLYLYGGIYADMDTECLRPLDALTQRPGVVLGRMGSDDDFPHAVPNAIMASAPRCDFWLLVMALLLHLSRYRGQPEQVTGPVVLQSALRLYQANDPLYVPSLLHEIAARLGESQKPAAGRTPITLLAPTQWYPLNWHDPVHDQLRRQILAGLRPSDEEHQRLFRHSTMVTYWAHSWATSIPPQDNRRGN